MPTKKQSGYERQMERLNNSIVYIKNIDDEDFQHTYAGEPYYIEAGRVEAFVRPVGILMAKHLAMKVARKQAAVQGLVDPNKDRQSGRDVKKSIYNDKAIDKLADEIIQRQEEQPLPPVKNEAQVMKEKTEQIQKEMGAKVERMNNGLPVDKKEIVKELEKLGIKFDARKSPEELLKLITDHEARDTTDNTQE